MYCFSHLAKYFLILDRTSVIFSIAIYDHDMTWKLKSPIITSTYIVYFHNCLRTKSAWPWHFFYKINPNIAGVKVSKPIQPNPINCYNPKKRMVTLTWHSCESIFLNSWFLFLTANLLATPRHRQCFFCKAIYCMKFPTQTVKSFHDTSIIITNDFKTNIDKFNHHYNNWVNNEFLIHFRKHCLFYRVSFLSILLLI